MCSRWHASYDNMSNKIIRSDKLADSINIQVKSLLSILIERNAFFKFVLLFLSISHTLKHMSFLHTNKLDFDSNKWSRLTFHSSNVDFACILAAIQQIPIGIWIYLISFLFRMLQFRIDCNCCNSWRIIVVVVVVMKRKTFFCLINIITFKHYLNSKLRDMWHALGVLRTHIMKM